MGINIAIDGPAGAGKSTIAKSGKGAVLYLCRYRAMYRAMALYLLEKGISGDEKFLKPVTMRISLSVMRTVSSR